MALIDANDDITDAVGIHVPCSTNGDVFAPYEVARNPFDSEDGFLKHKRFLLLGRDPLYTSQFRALLSSAGVTPICLPASSPNLNAYAERFVRSIKSECLNKLVLLGENHLRAAIREYLLHYH